jgi:glycerol-3-phosphate cytidylyltransferase-like family protein
MYLVAVVLQYTIQYTKKHQKTQNNTYTLKTIAPCRLVVEVIPQNPRVILNDKRQREFHKPHGPPTSVT